MKRLILFAIIIAINLIYGKSWGQGKQVSIYSFGSLSYETLGLKFKDRLGVGYGLSWDIGSVIGVGFQHKHRELCGLSRADNATTYFDTWCGEFYIHDNVPVCSSGKMFLYPKVGFLFGLGTPIKEKTETKSLTRMKKDLELRDHYYLGGVILEMDFGINLSPRFSMASYVRTDALVGLITKRPMEIENGYSFGSLSLGLKLFLKLTKK